MKEKRVTKKAILASLLSVAVCTSMLIGTSYAWFTDSAVSSGNVIKSGKLDIEFQVYDEEAQDYVNVNGPIFTYDKWEPGFVAWKNVKVTNVGNLALKYTLQFTGANLDNKLAEVIDVYYAPAEQLAPEPRPGFENGGVDPGALQEYYKGTLADVFNGEVDAIDDNLLPGESDSATVVLRMQTTAGNEYQNQTIGEFGMSVVATQYTYEVDSFDKDYDADAALPQIRRASTAAELTQALQDANDDDIIMLTDDIALTDNVTIKKNVTIDGNGKKISEKSIYVDSDSDVTFTNINFDTVKNASNKATFIYATSNYAGKMVIDNCTFTDAQWEGMQILPVAGAEIAITNCTFNTTENLVSANSNKGFRYIHFQATSGKAEAYHVTITGNTFNNLDRMLTGSYNSIIDVDCVDAGSTLTIGNNTFTDLDLETVTDANVGYYLYVSKGAGADETCITTMDMFNALVAADVTTITVS